MEFVTKYKFSFDERDIIIQRLIGQIWKLIPMREKEEDWGKQLNNVIIEVAGLNEIFISPQFIQLLSKLEGMNVIELDFETFKKNVFDCISLVKELNS